MRSDTTKKRDKWLNIYDYGNAYIKGTDLYQNPLKATSERNFGMSKDKYVIANCPMYFHTNCYGHTGNCECQDCTDCVLKQIVELCEDEVELVKKWQEETKYPFKPTAFELAEKILNQLDIQEVE